VDDTPESENIREIPDEPLASVIWLTLELLSRRSRKRKADRMNEKVLFGNPGSFGEGDSGGRL